MQQKSSYQPLSTTQYIAFFAMVVGMFMAVLDIQIVASSLSTIAAGLGASNDELSWVQTSYLIAEVVIIPITGFIARLLSTRISYFIATLGFTVMSVFCALAQNIETMIIFRALQGFFGGAMIPTVFSTVYILFPAAKRPMIMVIVGLVVTMAPTLGPTLGGYITDALSWHFMFLLNVIPGICVSIIVYLYADFDKPHYDLLKNFDYIGVTLLVLTLGCLEYVLEEGNKKGWLEDTLILCLSIVCVVSFILLIIQESTFINPILDLTAFLDKNFIFGCTYSFALGVGLYGAVYLLPLFLFTISGYSTLQIGFTMMVTGSAQFCSAPIAGRALSSGIDLRIIMAFGLILFSYGCYLNSFLTVDAKYDEFFWPQFLRGFSLMFCFLPNNVVALGGLSKEKVGNASGLYNLTRNLGGAVGLAMISTTLTNHTKTYNQYLNEHISATSPAMLSKLQFLTEWLDGKVADPEKASYFVLGNSINKEAFVYAVNNIFGTISILFFALVLLLPFTSNIKNAEEGHAH